MGTISTLLADHVGFRCRSVDRIGIRGYISGLMYEGGLAKFLVGRGNPIPSPAVLTRNRDRMVAELDALVARTAVEVVRFKSGQSKEDTARPYQDEAATAGRFGLVLVGKAQERTSSWRGWVDDSHPSHRPGHPHIAWRRQSSVPDHWYFYFADEQWGPAVLRMCSYAPYPLWVNANGHEWAKVQLARAGVGFEALDNGLRSVDDPAMAHQVCARLGAGHVGDLLARLMAVTPDPLMLDDRQRGFDWAFSVAQMEISDTAVFDQPRRGRAWFEAAIGAHLDLGRPEQVSLVVDRRIVNRGPHKTPGRFATEVIAADVHPQLQIHYKSSKVKAYLKEGKALRVETTINNASDFGLHKTLNTANWRALRATGDEINSRFLAAIGEDQPGLPDQATLEAVVGPSIHEGQRAPGLRFGEPRTMALLASVAGFAHVIGGLTNKGLRAQIAVSYQPNYSSAQASYDLRRLRLKGFIERIDGTHTYRVTHHGLRIATFFTQLAARIVVPTLTDLADSSLPPTTGPRPLTLAWRNYETELQNLLSANEFTDHSRKLASKTQKPRLKAS